MFATHGKRLIVGVLVFVSSSLGAYAYTNVVSVNDLTNAGLAVATLSTMTVDDDTIGFVPGGTPDILSKVTLQATSTGNIPSTGKGHVQLVSPSAPTPGGSTAGEWYPCVVTSAGGGATETFECDLVTTATTPVAVQDVDQFRILLHD